MNKIAWLILGGIAGVMMLIMFPFFMLVGGTAVAAVPNPPNTVTLQIQELVENGNELSDDPVDWQDVRDVLHVRLKADWDKFSVLRLLDLLRRWYEPYTATTCTDEGTEEICTKETRWRSRGMDEVTKLLKMTEDELQWLALVQAARQEISASSGTDCVPDGWQPTPMDDWIWPLQGYSRVTSCFGLRIDPVYGGQRFHSGLDVAAPAGAELVAPAPGLITSAGSDKVCGIFVVIKHSGGYKTHFCHLSESTVSLLQFVKQGQPIGKVGSTGKSTGPHMHIGMLRGGDYIDPLVVFGR